MTRLRFIRRAARFIIVEIVFSSIMMVVTLAAIVGLLILMSQYPWPSVLAFIAVIFALHVGVGRR